MGWLGPLALAGTVVAGGVVLVSRWIEDEPRRAIWRRFARERGATVRQGGLLSEMVISQRHGPAMVRLDRHAVSASERGADAMRTRAHARYVLGSGPRHGELPPGSGDARSRAAGHDALAGWSEAARALAAAHPTLRAEADGRRVRVLADGTVVEPATLLAMMQLAAALACRGVDQLTRVTEACGGRLEEGEGVFETASGEVRACPAWNEAEYGLSLELRTSAAVGVFRCSVVDGAFASAPPPSALSRPHDLVALGEVELSGNGWGRVSLRWSSWPDAAAVRAGLGVLEDLTTPPPPTSAFR